MTKYISGKSARRIRIRANHDGLHAAYECFLRDFGALLTYEQWLHSDARREMRKHPDKFAKGFGRFLSGGAA